MLDAVIIGAGPYGLSAASHFRSSGFSFRAFGRPMDSWLAHMPKGMMLKSDGFASNIYDPEGRFTLKQFCADKGIQYADTGIPVRLETFSAYGLAFRERMIPELEDRVVSSVDRIQDGFILRLDDGEVVKTRRVVMAVGITHFEYVPDIFSDVPAEFLSHSRYHHDPESFRGKKVVVVGGGSSAIDLAGLMHKSGVDVHLVSRRKELKFHTGPTGKRRSLWQRIRRPQSGLGPGPRSRFYSNTPMVLHYLPEWVRIQMFRTALGPSAGWFMRDMVVGRVPLLLGCTPQRAKVKDGMVHLELRGADGSDRQIVADHVISATGYRVDIQRLKLLSGEIRSALKALNATPILSSSFESSVPGLHFVGVAAANSFGPVMRFAFGAGFAAQRLTSVLEESLSRGKAFSPAARLVVDANDEAQRS